MSLYEPVNQQRDVERFDEAIDESYTERMPSRAHSTPPEFDPVLYSMEHAPIDDEPYTDEEREEVRRALAEYRDGELVTSEDVQRLLGL